ncbi:MAG: InlB B-repeat-containing protein [Lachnospiraceae bacterium]|nr:InlB B-repeat-containing protein [Lachnospiraceae bacterium]
MEKIRRLLKPVSLILTAALLVTGMPEIVSADPGDADWVQEYSYRYDENAKLMSEPGNNLAGVYVAKAVPGADKASTTLGIPSLAKQNLESAPTTESPAIIQGAAVPFEKRVNDSSTIRFDKISDEPVCAPYTYFRYELMEENNANGTGSHTKISGFDGTYVIIRVDVSDLLKDLPTDQVSYLHVKQTGNAAMQVLYGQDKASDTDSEGNPSYVKFSYNTQGAQAACFSLDNDSASLKDTDGQHTDKPYVDIILLSSGTLVEGADKGGAESAANPIKANFPISFYVDQIPDYDPSIEWDESTKSIINTETREAVQPKQIDEGGTTITVTPDEMMMDKYYNEKAATEQGQSFTVTGYTVMGDDLELEAEIDEIREDASTEEEYWSLRRAMDYQEFDNHTIRLICEAPILDGLLLDDTDDSDGESNRHVVLDVNSFDIQIANNTETKAAGLTVQGGATLTIMDGSNTTGAELAVGNNANMLIQGEGSRLIIDETCQLEVEYDSASQATPPEGEPQQELPDLSEGSLIIRDGGEVINEGVITVEGKEGKAQDPVDAQTVIRDYKDAKLTIGSEGRLTNEGCMLVNGSLYNLGTIVNNGRYTDLITSDDPDKGIFTYHKGIQFSWKDDVTQGRTNGGFMYNGMDEQFNEYDDAELINNGDIVLVPGYLQNAGNLTNNGNIYLSAVNEVMIPITATQDAPTVTEERFDLGYYEDSYLANYENATFTNKGSVRTADFEIVSNGRTGNIRSEVSPALDQLNVYNCGTLSNEGNGVIAANLLENQGTIENRDNAAFGAQYTVNGKKQNVTTKVLLSYDGRNGGGSLRDLSSKKNTTDVYNGAKTVENKANVWTYDDVKAFSVQPSSAYVGTGATVDWTVKAEPETQGTGVKYLVDLYLDNTGVPIDRYALPAGAEGIKVTSPAAPALSDTNLSYTFSTIGTKPVSAQSILHVNSPDEADNNEFGIVRPTAMQNLVYNGEPQKLVTYGSATEGNLFYKVDDGDYSPDRPTAVDAGTYAVTYKVCAGDTANTDVLCPEETISVTIAKSPLYLAADDQASKKGPGSELQILTYTAFGLVEADKGPGKLNISLSLPDGTTADSAVGAYPITLTIDEEYAAKNYEFTDADGESRISNGTYFITNGTVDLSSPAPMPTPTPSPTPTPIPGIKSKFTGYENMNESITLSAKYLKDEDHADKTTVAEVYYSDTIELDADNYKTDGTQMGVSYAAVGTDKTVYYYIRTTSDEKTPEGEPVVLDTLAGSQRVVIVKADQKTPGIYHETDNKEGIDFEPGFKNERGRLMFPNYKPRETEYEYRRADCDQYTRIVTAQIDVAPGYYYYIRRIGDARRNPSPDTEIYVADTGADVPVFFSANAGDFGEDDEHNPIKTKTVDVGYGKVISDDMIPEPPTRDDGVTFAGWEQDGKPFDFANTPITSPIRLEAVWNVNTYTVTFDPHGGSYVDPQRVEEGKNAARPEDVTYTGYSLDKWVVQGTETAYTFTEEVRENITLEAVWKPVTYKVTFNSNGGTGGTMADQSFTYDERMPLDKNTFTREDHVFAGWDTKADGKGTDYSDEQPVWNLASEQDKTITLYAQWKKLLSSDDGTTPSDGITVTVANAANLIYNGKALRPSVIIKDGGTDITKYCSFVYENNVNAGTAKVTATVKSTNAPYAGKISQEFTIRKTEMDNDSDLGEFRQYLYSDAVSDQIDLMAYLPSDAGETTWVIERDEAGGFKYDTNPDVAGGILSYAVAKAESAGGNATIYAKATMTNYKGSAEETVTIEIELGQVGLTIAEKVGREYVSTGLDMRMTAGNKTTFAAMFAEGAFENQRVRWTSSNPAVATVTQDGKVTALAPGQTEITVECEDDADDEKDAFCDLTVLEPVTTLTLDQKSYSMGTGEVIELFASAVPFTADRTLSWSVNNANAKIVSISDDTMCARIVAVGAGSAKVTAAATDGSKKTAVCNLSIGNPVGQFTIAAKGNAKALAVGKTLGFTIDWKGSKPKNSNVIWQVRTPYGDSDVSKIATISQKGVLTGISEGLVRITAISVSNPEKTASAEVAVYVPIRKASLNVTSGTLSQADRDKYLDLDAFVTPSVAGSKVTGVNLGTEPTVKYEVDPKYAGLLSVDSMGRVKIKKNVDESTTAKNIPVYATISAFDNYSKKLTCKVTIKEANKLKGVKLSATKLTIGEGNLAEISASPDPVNADGDQTIFWGSDEQSVSDNKDVAEIITKTENKVIRHYVWAKKAGTANITIPAVQTVDGKTVSATCKVTVKPSVKTIDFKDISRLEEDGLAVGKTFTLKPQLLDADGKTATTELVYTTSNEKIATVNEKGVIKAVAPERPGDAGVVTITATSTDIKKDGAAPVSRSVTFRVYAPVSKVVLDKTKLTVGTRDKDHDLCGNRYGKISIATLLPENVTNAKISWVADNQNVKILAIDQAKSAADDAYDEAFEGAGQEAITDAGEALAVMGMTPGTTKLSGVTLDGTNKKVTCTVTVRGDVTRLALKEQAGQNGYKDVKFVRDDTGAAVPKPWIEYESTMKPGTSMTLTPLADINEVSASDANLKKTYSAYAKFTDTSVSYLSLNPDIATVTNNGKISVNKDAENNAEVNILVFSAAGNKASKLTITVKNP